MKVLESQTKIDAKTSSTSKWIHDFLQANPVGVLTTVDPNGDPHATVIYFSIDPQFNILFMTKNETKKYDNLLHNNHAMLLVYDTPTQTTVQITAKAIEQTDKTEIGKAFVESLRTAKAKSESGIPPILKLHAGDYTAFVLRPVRIRMAMFIRPDPGGYDIYETLDF